MDGKSRRPDATITDLVERDHELSATLYGIETTAAALVEQRDRLRSDDVDQLVQAIASEARRLRTMLAAEAEQQVDFDLAEAIRPVILMIRATGVVVRDAVPAGTWVCGTRDHTVQVVFGLLDNARVHAPGSTVDLRVATGNGTTTLYVEDRGPGCRGTRGRHPFDRDVRGAHSPGSGLGLYIAQRLMIDQGGSLTVDRRVGGGSSFAVRLLTARSASVTPLRDRHTVGSP